LEFPTLINQKLQSKVFPNKLFFILVSPNQPNSAIKEKNVQFLKEFLKSMQNYGVFIEKKSKKE